ncbi:MAG: helix-turn-helix domain-containing protein [Bacteroidales bacterium]|nr:helix-turn-helix domain-containing protein [Bacteroidales bacterium]
MLFADKIKQLREESGQLQRKVAAALDIDAGLYSKIERGERPAKREQVINLASILHTDEKELLTLWLADQIKEITESEKEIAQDAINIVSNK